MFLKIVLPPRQENETLDRIFLDFSDVLYLKTGLTASRLSNEWSPEGLRAQGSGWGGASTEQPPGVLIMCVSYKF